MGVRVMRLNEADKVVSVSKIVENGENNNDNGCETTDE
jgi:hypothetical protein